ncbi:MAG: hypothetical protein AAFO57_00945 [Pseudomonadota bacterium]
MLRGLPASLVLHAAVIGAGSIVLPTMARDISSESVIVPIDIVTISDITNIAPRVERDAPEPETEEPPPLEDYLEDLDTIAPEDVEPAEEEDAPTAPPDEADEPEPVIIPEEEPEETPEPDEPGEPEPEEPEETEDRPILEAEQEDPLDSILGQADNLFDRTPRNPTRSPPKAPEPEDLEDEQPTKSEQQAGAGERTDNTAAISAVLYDQLYICWDDVVDLPNPERLNVTIKMELNRDGTIASGPRLVDPARPPIGDRAMGVAIERALRAARKCAPYRLPGDESVFAPGWEEVILNIGPAYKQ